MPLDPVYFGKLPTRGDFVRHNAGRPSVRALDDWIQRGLRTAQAHPDFDHTFDATPARCFFFNPKEVPGALIGVMQPSRDRSGRRYPFLIALSLEERALPLRRMARAPVHFRPFFEQALPLARRAIADQIDPQHLLDHLDPAALPAPSSSGALRGYKRYLRQTRLDAFWEQLWDGRADDHKQRLVGNLVEVLGPLQGGVPARFSLGMQFPLPHGDADTDANTDAYAASFWWETCLRLLRFPDVAPTCFWTATDDDDDSPPADGDRADGDRADGDRSVLLFLRPPYARTLAHLLLTEQESDHIYVLDRHGAERATQAAQNAPPRYDLLLDDRQLTLWEVLQQLEPG